MEPWKERMQENVQGSEYSAENSKVNHNKSRKCAT